MVNGLEKPTFETKDKCDHATKTNTLERTPLPKCSD